jgi:hypothetical protein
MAELGLFKFLQDTEVRWVKDETGTFMLLAWIPFYELQEFVNLIDGYILNNFGIGITCNLQWKCVFIDLTPICEYFDIDPERIRPLIKP